MHPEFIVFYGYVGKAIEKEYFMLFFQDELIGFFSFWIWEQIIRIFFDIAFAVTPIFSSIGNGNFHVQNSQATYS